jgi:hypothetical protein
MWGIQTKFSDHLLFQMKKFSAAMFYIFLREIYNFALVISPSKIVWKIKKF